MDIVPSDGMAAAAGAGASAPPPQPYGVSGENGVYSAPAESPDRRPWPNEREDYDLKEVIGKGGDV